MPTVHRFRGLRVVIYPNDHVPAHAHVIGRGCEAVFKIDGSLALPELRENYGFSAGELAVILAELGEHVGRLSAAWRAIHGDD